MFSEIDHHNLQDYRIDDKNKINQGTKWPIIEEYCSCGERFGVFQRAIESTLGDLLKKKMPLSEARKEMIRVCRIPNRDCCLRTISNYPFEQFYDIHGIDSYIDTTQVSTNTKSSKEIDNIKRENVFSKELVPESVGWFPLNSKDEFDRKKYEKKLWKETVKDYDKDVDDNILEKPRFMFPVNQHKRRVFTIKTTKNLPFQEDEEEISEEE